MPRSVPFLDLCVALFKTNAHRVYDSFYKHGAVVLTIKYCHNNVNVGTMDDDAVKFANQLRSTVAFRRSDEFQKVKARWESFSAT